MKDDHTLAACHPGIDQLFMVDPGLYIPSFIVHSPSVSVMWGMVPVGSRATRKLYCWQIDGVVGNYPGTGARQGLPGLITYRIGCRVPNVPYTVLERSCRVRATVPTPNPSRFAICRIETPRRRNSATRSRSNTFLGRRGAKSLPDRLWTVLPTLPAA